MTNAVLAIHIEIYQHIPDHGLNTLVSAVDISGILVFSGKVHCRILHRNTLHLAAKVFNTLVGAIHQLGTVLDSFPIKQLYGL